MNVYHFLTQGSSKGAKEDIVKHVTSFEQAILANWWDDKNKVIYFQMYLENVALTYYESLEQNHKITFDLDRGIKTFTTFFAPEREKDMVLLCL